MIDNTDPVDPIQREIEKLSEAEAKLMLQGAIAIMSHPFIPFRTFMRIRESVESGDIVRKARGSMLALYSLWDRAGDALIEERGTRE